jgi:uncharacterized protein YyaL (SSP411 family)
LHIDAAKHAASFILEKLRKPDGQLFRRYRQGDVAYPGYLDDYSFLVWGLIELYEATFDISCLEDAVEINQVMIDLFWDDSKGGFYFTGKDNEILIARSKEIYDGALPSGNSVAALSLMRLGRMTGNPDLEKKADELTRTFSRGIATYPVGHSQFLSALDFMVGPGFEIVIAGDTAIETTRAMLEVVNKTFLPNKVLLLQPGGDEGRVLSRLVPFVEALHPINHQPTVYLCEQYVCKTPITDVENLKLAIKFG